MRKLHGGVFMKRSTSFKNVWSFSKGMYINLGEFSFHFSFIFMGTFLALIIFMLCIGQHLPLPKAYDNPFVRYLVIPGGTAWVMDHKTFDDKRPYKFLMSALIYMVRPKQTYRGHPISCRTGKLSMMPTIVCTLPEERMDEQCG